MKNKIKTNKSASKRYKITATGKVKFKRAGLRHNLGKKGRKVKRKLVDGKYIVRGDRRHVFNVLPNGSLL